MFGELCIGGAGVARGYVGQPELTAERFVADRFSADTGARLYRTGDRARLMATGEVELDGRLDDQVKVRGVRIELGEIEHALLQCQGVGAAAAVVLGKGGGAVIGGFVVPHPGAVLMADDLARQLRRQLPSAMCPTRYAVLGELPFLPNGKVDRRTLQSLGGATTGVVRPYRPPATEVEHQLAAVWQEVLGVPRVGVDDNFFELGGHSLVAVQFASRAKERFGLEIPLRLVFATADLGELAASLVPRMPPSS